MATMAAILIVIESSPEWQVVVTLFTSLFYLVQHEVGIKQNLKLSDSIWLQW